MVYPNLKFPKKTDKPFFYTNFVQTIDGKVHVKKKGYWPIGSKTDYQVLTELRAYADCLIHGGNLAREFGEVTIKSLSNKEFQAMRRKMGKNPLLPYYVITKNPQLYSHMSSGNVVAGNLHYILNELKSKGYKHVLIEGGPTLLGSFLKKNLIDEVFLTITPKIYGSKDQVTLTLVEGILFSADQIIKLELKSVKKIGDELFIRYKISS